mmetsp:Transcript_116851/g.325625  ORF Transcript_116851/g.325625 Transcript_116851/m.325625 type:complete len:203 (-) Transcript_116851:294-902(-)
MHTPRGALCEGVSRLSYARWQSLSVHTAAALLMHRGNSKHSVPSSLSWKRPGRARARLLGAAAKTNCGVLRCCCRGRSTKRWRCMRRLTSGAGPNSTPDGRPVRPCLWATSTKDTARPAPAELRRRACAAAPPPPSGRGSAWRPRREWGRLRPRWPRSDAPQRRPGRGRPPVRRPLPRPPQPASRLDRCRGRRPRHPRRRRC